MEEECEVWSMEEECLVRDIRNNIQEVKLVFLNLKDVHCGEPKPIMEKNAYSNLKHITWKLKQEHEVCKKRIKKWFDFDNMWKCE